MLEFTTTFVRNKLYIEPVLLYHNRGSKSKYIKRQIFSKSLAQVEKLKCVQNMKNRIHKQSNSKPEVRKGHRSKQNENEVKKGNSVI